MAKTKRPKRLWRNFLLDARYQMSFTLPMVLVAATLFAGLGYVAMRKAEAATKIGLNQIEKTGSTYLENAEETRATLLRREWAIDIAIVLVGLGLCLGLALYGVVLSHRIAGPLYRLRIELGKMQEGKLTPVAPLRKGDQLTELYDSFRLACEAIRERERQELDVLRRVIAAVKKSGAISEEKLELLQERVRAKEVALG